MNVKGLISAICLTAALSTSLPASSQENDGQKFLNHPMPTSWAADNGFETAPYDDAAWWTRFGDSVLDSLIVIGEQNNYDLSIAARRIEIARRRLDAARSAYYPQIGVSAGWTRTRRSGAAEGRDVPASVSSAWDLGASASWEIDVFGKITSQVRQGKANVRLSRADFEAALVSLRAQIATTYIQLRVYQNEMEVARRHSESQLKVVRITEARHEAGLASQLDVAQAKTVYYSTISQIPLLENSINATINALSVMLGEYPDSLRISLTALAPLPDYNQITSAGMPMDLLTRRPDIIAAREQIAVASEQLGIARKDYLPSLAITGSIGTQARDAKDLFKRNSFTYTVAPVLSWTLFDGFARRAATAEAREQLSTAVDNYNLTVLTAVEETDNAMSAYVHYLNYIRSINDVVEQSQEAEKLSLDLYKGGLTAFTNVVDAQLNLLTYQNSLVVAQGEALTALVSLYKALGGGWQIQ